MAASREIAGTGEFGHVALAAQIDHDSMDASLRDPQVIAAFGQWLACMKQAGYDYHDPYRAGADYRRYTPSPTQAEITAVLADIACKQCTHLVDVWSGVERAYGPGQRCRVPKPPTRPRPTTTRPCGSAVRSANG